MFIRKNLFTWLAAFLFTLPLVAQETGESLLDAVREATGHAALRAWAPGILVEGKGEATGLECAFTLHYLADGRFRSEADSELGEIQGFDGKRGWSVDFSGMPGHLEGKELEIRQMQAWIMGGHWLDEGCPLTFALDEKSDHRIQIKHPIGLVKAYLDVDPGTSLPRTFTWIERGRENRLSFEDYREVNGFRFPHTFRTQEDDQLVLIEVKRVGKASEEACEAVTRRPADTKFDAGKPATMGIKRTPTGHVLVHPLINGKDVGWFFLDTGAGWSAINSAAADKLELEKFGEVTAVGVGGQVQAHFRKAASLELGPVTLENPSFVEVDLSAIGMFFGCELGGALGYNFLSRVPVELDEEGETVTLCRPGTWNDRKAPWREIVFDGNIPAVTCRTEGGLEGLFHLDTGSGGTVEFHKAFVHKHKLLEGRDVKKAFSGGVGGMITTFTGKVDWFELGGHRFKAPDVAFADASDGVFSDEASAGNIGNGFMSHFRMLIDYPNKRIGWIKRAD
jgi:hypothetical protein